MNREGCRVTVLATGPRFLRSRVRAIEPVLVELIEEAREELHVAMYALEDGAGTLVEALERAILRGLRCVLVLGRVGPGGRDTLERFLRLRTDAPGLLTVVFREPEGGVLHAKVVVADRRKAVVGSANLTWGGLRGNHEIGVLVEGEPAWQIAELVDVLAAGDRD